MSRADFVAFRRSLPRTPRLERQDVRVRGLPLAVWSSPPVGDRPPLVCINGGMLYDHSMLWPALSPLAAGRQLVLYDQRGRGASPSPSDPLAWTIDDDAADVGALRRALGIRRWDVLGHSWGGGIAMLGVLADSGGTRRLVLVDAVGPTSAWMSPLRTAALARLDGAQRAALEAIDDQALGAADPELHSRHAKATYPAWFADAELAAYFAPPTASSVTGATVLAKLRGSRYDWRARLRALSVPTLVVHGEQDPLPVTVAEELSALVPGARRVLVPTSGHMPFWEAPTGFFRLVDAFLEARSPAAVPLSS